MNTNRALLNLVSLFIGVLLSRNSFGQNITALEASLAKNPSQKILRVQLANIYYYGKKYDKVIELLNPYTDQLTASGFLTLSSAFSESKDYTNEALVLTLVSAKDETNYRWPFLLAQAKLKEAYKLPVSPERSALTTTAIQKLRASLKIQPGYKPAFDVLLDTLLQNKIHNEARELLMEGISKFGDRPELFSNLCRIDSIDGFLEQAVGNCRSAIKLAPTYPDNYVYLVQSLFDQNDEQQAERNIVSTAKRFSNSEFVQWAAGMLFFKKKNFPVATRYFEAALRAQPKSGRAHYGVAQARFESGNAKGALEHYVKACEYDRATVDSFLAAGGRLKLSGNYELGLQYIQKANTCGG